MFLCTLKRFETMKQGQFFFAIALTGALITACSHQDTEDCSQPTQQFIGEAPDYNDDAMWYTERNDTNNTGADVFYVISTWEYDWYTPDSIISHYADITNPKHLADMNIEMKQTAAYMADGNNYYAPYYRHISLNSWATLNEDTISNRFHAISFLDIQDAFNHYLEHWNHNRPFILAGFSQGGKSVVELMKRMPEEVRQRMVAAYVLGYKVTEEDLQTAPWIKAAQDSTDTGVTVCYNSVSDVKYIKSIVSAPNTMCINPVNWRTDSTPATLHDTITVTLNTAHHVLVLKGFDGSSLPNILDVLNTGDYHGVEPGLYSECLRKNIKQRIAAFK
jgi:hypothetical protein